MYIMKGLQVPVVEFLRRDVEAELTGWACQGVGLKEAYWRPTDVRTRSTLTHTHTHKYTHEHELQLTHTHYTASENPVDLDSDPDFEMVD